MRIMTEEGETIAEIRIGAKKLKSRWAIYFLISTVVIEFSFLVKVSTTDILVLYFISSLVNV